MEKKGTLLTNELYETIIDNLVRDVVRLKKEQGKSISKISIEKEVLQSLKDELKQTKKDIRVSKRTLSTEKRKLTKINNGLNERNHLITDLNYSFIPEEPRTIDLTKFAFDQPQKRR